MKAMVSSLTSKLPGSKSSPENRNGDQNGHVSKPGTKSKSKASAKSPMLIMHEARPRPRVKLGPGFNQMSWMQLTQKASDLAGLKGKSPNKEYTMAQVRQHQMPHDLWMVVHGKIYNVSKYVPYHPGGVDVLMRGAGDDASALFDEFHTWVNASGMLAKCLVGRLAAPLSRGPDLAHQWPTDDAWTYCVMSERAPLRDSPTCWRVSLMHHDSLPLPPPDDTRSHIGLPYHVKVRISIGEGSKRRVIERPYTPLTHPMDLVNCGVKDSEAAAQQGHLHLMIKVYEDGLMSRLLIDKFKAGVRVDVQLRPSRIEFPVVGVVRDTGRSPAMELKGVKEMGMIAAGTGIAPMLQVIHLMCNRADDPTILHVVYFNHGPSDMPMANTLRTLSRTHKRLRVLFVCTSDQQGNETDEMVFGRAQDGVLDKRPRALPKASDFSCVLVCGPPTFERDMRRHMLIQGFESGRVLTF